MLVYFPYRNALETAHFTKSDEDPTSFTSAGNKANLIRGRGWVFTLPNKVTECMT
jgi:hypothetical protein